MTDKLLLCIIQKIDAAQENVSPSKKSLLGWVGTVWLLPIAYRVGSDANEA